jgi:plasmid stabilization system protein ParE
MSEVKWRPKALADIARLHAFLQDKNPQAAARAMGVILEGANSLKAALRIGCPMPDDTGRRELFLPFAAGAYVLRYMLDGDTAVVLRVWHSREHRTG